MADYWGGCLERARKLDANELIRYASDSRNRHHRCHTCWNCACWTELEERSRESAARARKRARECDQKALHTH